MGTRLRAAVGRAPGKLILAGEHAVVHGRPAVALPFPAAGVVAEAEPAEGPLTISTAMAGADLAGLREAAEATLRHMRRPVGGLSIHLASTLPMGAGLGSSAAAAVAVVRAVAAAGGVDLDEAEQARLADVAERHAHGRPSGLDVAAVVASGPILFRRDEPVHPLAGAMAPLLVVADSGRPRDTRSAVAAVAMRLTTEPTRAGALLDALGEAAMRAGAALKRGEPEALGQAMDGAQAALAALGVSDPQLEALIAAARGAGALGAKLTGAGRGGCVVALAPDLAGAVAIAQALTAAGAVRVWAPAGAPPEGAA